MRQVKRSFIFFGLLVWLLLFQTAGRAANPWFIRINIPEFKLYLYQGTEIFQTYPIAVGKPKTQSPIGEFRIVNKVVNPTWFPPHHAKPVPPGPNNPLGKYWMGLSITGYGIHGNHSPLSIGNSASLGCFRMFNHDIEELFKLVPTGTPVQITYETVTAQSDGECLVLDIYPDIYSMKNQDNALNEAIVKSGWSYEPHWQALHELLRRHKLSSLEVPRLIQLEGDLPDEDGFYWNGEVYINWKKINGLTVDAKTAELSPDFSDYVSIEQLRVLAAGVLTVEWDPDLNIVKILRQSPVE